MKHAFLFIPPVSFDQLRCLVDYFQNENCYIFLLSNEDSPFSHAEWEAILQKEGVKKIEHLPAKNKKKKSNLLEERLFLLEQSLQNCDADYFHLMSGQDHPIKPLNSFLSYFIENWGMESLDCHPLLSVTCRNYVYKDFPGVRIDPFNLLYFPMPQPLRFFQQLYASKSITSYKHRFQVQITDLYISSDWFSLKRESVTYLLSYTKDFPAFYYFALKTLYPEKLYIASVLMNDSRFIENLRPVRLRYTEQPETQNTTDPDTDYFFQLVTTPAFFVNNPPGEQWKKIHPMINQYVLGQNIVISDRGGWEHNTFAGHCFDQGLCEALLRICKLGEIGSVVDFGCGPGWYVAAFQRNHILAKGYDANPNTKEFSSLFTPGEGRCEQANLAHEFILETPVDLVLSLEMGEHIPQEFESQLIQNMVRNTRKYLILSWALPGQPGDGHINCQPNEYIIEKITRYGFSENKIIKKYLREQAQLSWFKETIMVFERIPH